MNPAQSYFLAKYEPISNQYKIHVQTKNMILLPEQKVLLI